MRAILYLLLVVDCVQAGFGVAALVRGGRSARAGAPSHARYARSHGVLLLGGAVLMAVPVLLGLLGAISATVAVIVAVVLEISLLPVSRSAVKSLEAAHHERRPGARPAG